MYSFELPTHIYIGIHALSKAQLVWSIKGWAIQYIMAYMPSGGAHTFEREGAIFFKVHLPEF